jgi:hypothetical protein
LYCPSTYTSYRRPLSANPCISTHHSLFHCILYRGHLTVRELAELLDEKPVSVIKLLMTDLGVMASMTQSLDPATCVAVVEGFGKVVGNEFSDDEDM